MIKTTKESNKHHEFWEWFRVNSELYFEPDKLKESHFKQLLGKLKIIDKHLTFEIGPVEDMGKRQLIISANGITSAFDTVLNLVNKAPEFDRWEVLSFRQRRPDAFDEVRINDLAVKKDDVFFKYAKDFGRIELEMHVRNYDEDREEYNLAALIILDHLLGEYDTEMRISSICFEILNENEKSDLFPISMLPEIVDEYYLEFHN